MAVPQINIIQLDNITDPSGTRDAAAGMNGFVKYLDTSTSGHLDFGTVNITNSGTFSATQLLFFRPESFGDASEIFNFRFFLSSTSSWDIGTYYFKWAPEVHFESAKALDLGADGIPTSLPATQNVLSTQSGTFIQAIAESGCSQYIYMNVFASPDTTVGQYGGPGNGGFRYRLTYDFR